MYLQNILLQNERFILFYYDVQYNFKLFLRDTIQIFFDIPKVFSVFDKILPKHISKTVKTYKKIEELDIILNLNILPRSSYVLV